MTKEPLKSMFDAGSVVVVPQNVEVAPLGEKFHFVPLFFFVEWCTWNPIQLSKDRSIVERTFDSRSPIAAKSRDPNLRMEPHPENERLFLRHVEHLNFVLVIIGDHPAAGMPVVKSWARGDHKAGSSFAGLISMRKAPIFGCQFEAVSRLRTNPQGDWYGLDVSNPSEDSGVGSWTPEDVYPKLRDMHMEFKRLHSEALIQVDHDDEDSAVETDSNKF
jgi:hypothetical protein